MLTKDILRELHLGASVAEHDEALDDYFIETETFRALVADRRDTIAGDKGTGKTALYRILQKRYPALLSSRRAGLSAPGRGRDAQRGPVHHDL